MFTIGSKILGFIGELLIAARFGSGAETDTFFIALTAITLFRTMITKSDNTTAIPVLSEVGVNKGKIGKWSHTNNLLNIVGIIFFILMALAWIFAVFVMKILACGFEGEQFKLAVLLMRIGLLTILFIYICRVSSGAIYIVN